MNAPTPKKMFIRTYGCQMNVYDSERMTEALTGAGYEAVDAPEDADLVLLNTCHIREKAAEKVYSELGRIRKMAAEKAERGGGAMRVGVTGCVAQAEGEEIVRRQPLVDLVVGPQAYHRLPAMLDALDGGAGAQVVTDFPTEDKFEALPQRAQRKSPSAFLSVQEGCDKFCAFCVVPYTRGAEFSRPVAQVMTEARRLAASGVREVTLLGQNVNAYHGEGDGGAWSLARLIRAIAGIEGIERIRYTTSHPNDMDDDLIAAHADTPELMPYLHLPVQSGSDRVLKAMNRKHTAEDYLRLIERIRATRPDMALSGDFIVGFPGETDADFEDTLALVEATRYAQAFSFKYSPRPGTPASTAEQVPEAVKDARLARLQASLRAHQTRFQEDCVGRTMPVLFEKAGREPGQLVGRSPYLQPVHAYAPETLLRRIVPVRMEAAFPNSLSGTLIEEVA